jgi:hypothetical protein
LSSLASQISHVAKVIVFSGSRKKNKQNCKGNKKAIGI